VYVSGPVPVPVSVRLHRAVVRSAPRYCSRKKEKMGWSDLSVLHMDHTSELELVCGNQAVDGDAQARFMDRALAESARLRREADRL